ncbi:MAG: DUF6883 domain-containing protein [Candidatus Binatia bacterium]
MKLPFADRAVVDLVKLSDYALSPDHEEGKHKARVFAAALGIGREHANWLRDRLLEAAQTHECVPGRRTKFGERYTIDFELSRAGRSAMIRSCWMVRPGEDFPRLTSCYVL